MESISSENYEYAKTKKDIYELLDFMEKIKEEDFKLLSEKLDYLIKASQDLGIAFIYLLLSLKHKKSQNNVGNYLITLYFEEKEKLKIEKLSYIIMDAFNFTGPKGYLISNPIENEFLKNIENLGILDNIQENKQRPEGTLIENIYFKIISTIDMYNTYISIDEHSIKDKKEIQDKIDECQKDIDILKEDISIKNFKFNNEFFNDLLETIDYNKLHKKPNSQEDNFTKNNNDDLSLSKSSSSLSKSFQNIENIPLKKREFFLRNETVSQGEGVEIEFKDYYFEKPWLPNNLVDIIKHLICGMLNSNGGRIYFGINDNKIVKGCKLEYKLRDEVSLFLINLTSNFYPDCKSSKIKVDFIPVKDPSNNKFLREYYVIKMMVKQGDTDKLYSVSNKVYESYKRIQGMVVQLKPEEIAKEIFERKSKPKEPIPETEFDDPEPSMIFYENDKGNFHVKRKNNKKKKTHKKFKGINNDNNKLYTIKVTNIDEEIPIFVIDSLFEEYKEFIEDKNFFEKDGLSTGFGYIFTKNLESAKILKQNFDGKKIYNKNIHLVIQNN